MTGSEGATVQVGLRAEVAQALEAVAAGAGRDLAWAVDQAVERHLEGARRDAELEALLAEAEAVEARSEEDRSGPEPSRPDCAVPCICCGRPMEEHGSNQPRGGLAFASHGHWPSAVFDMAAGWLEINVCEPCLSAGAERSRVLHGERRDRRGPTDYVPWVWPERAPRPEGAVIVAKAGPEGLSASRLAALLARQPPDRRVVIEGYEGGYADVSGLTERGIALGVRKSWYYGPHEESVEPDEVAIEIRAVRSAGDRE